MPLIERAARAMYEQVQPEWDWEDPDAELLRKMYHENARAALMAIREPTDNMLEYGAELFKGSTDDLTDDSRRDNARETWHAILDAILDERS